MWFHNIYFPVLTFTCEFCNSLKCNVINNCRFRSSFSVYGKQNNSVWISGLQIINVESYWWALRKDNRTLKRCMLVQHEPFVLTIIVRFLTNRRSDISTNSKRNAWGRPPSKPEDEEGEHYLLLLLTLISGSKGTVNTLSWMWLYEWTFS